MGRECVQMSALGAAAAVDFTVNRIAADRGRVIQKASIILSGATAGSAVGDHRVFHLRNLTAGTNLASRATFVDGAASEIAANTEVELTFALSSARAVNEGTVLALFADAVGGGAGDLSAVHCTLKIEWI